VIYVKMREAERMMALQDTIGADFGHSTSETSLEEEYLTLYVYGVNMGSIGLGSRLIE
jgi:hypothetical protein